MTKEQISKIVCEPYCNYPRCWQGKLRKRECRIIGDCIEKIWPIIEGLEKHPNIGAAESGT